MIQYQLPYVNTMNVQFDKFWKLIIIQLQTKKPTPKINNIIIL